MSCVQETHWFSFGESSLRIDERVPITPHRRATLLFLHGRLSHGGLWAPLLERLDRDFRCLVVHFPGIGGLDSSIHVGSSPFALSDWVALAQATMDRMIDSHEEFFLIGQDLGGLVAQLSLIRSLRPCLAGLILINSSHLMGGCLLKAGWRGWELRRRYLKLMKNCSWKNQNFEFLLAEPWKDPTSRLNWVDAIRAIESSWPGIYERGYWMDRLREIRQPVRLLWGGRDELNSLDQGIQLMNALPQADLMETDTSHWPQLENPDWVAIQLRDFTFKFSLKGSTSPVRKSLLR